MRMPTRTLAAVLAAVALALSGCGSVSQGASTGGTGAEAASHASPSVPGHHARAVTVEVTIRKGEITPAGQRANATAEQPIVLRVTSDQADEIHVHAQPEHEFHVKPNQPQTFRFTLNRPGVYEVESHETETLILSVAVRP